MATATAGKKDAIHYHELHRPAVSMAAEVRAGLSRRQKYLPPKLFYDKTGSELFDVITRLPEYYPTRTEIGLLRRHADEMAELLGSHSVLLELGSGSSIKIRLLLEAVRPRIYVPMDISREHLIDAAQALARDYPWLTVHAACVDYSQPWDMPDFGPGRHNAFFPGSSIGNFEPAAALQLLRQVRRLVGRDGGLLIGVDLKKDTGILECAYNDKQGVTADFNLNMLAHINRRLDADFDPGNFAHKAIYNADLGRIEMHLECRRDHRVRIDGDVYRFAAGETIHTENSYKYSIAEFHGLAARAGFAPVRVWSDQAGLFSVHYLTAD
ncbi:MAG: L-histidine N(alpha)-methyltransferase [Gammaproteobacteria bacterium]